MSMLVREVMTSPAVTIGPSALLSEAVSVLDRQDLTSVPVVDQDGRLLGIVGEADVIRRLTTEEEHGHIGDHRVGAPRVSDVMTHRVITAHADDEVTSVVALMSGTTLKSLPVLLHDRVAGMVSRRDIVRAIAHGAFDARPTHELSTS